jgi:hypothetical protein
MYVLKTCIKEASMYRISVWMILSAALLTACAAAETPTPSGFPTSSPIVVTTHPTLILTPDPSMNTKTSPTDSSELDPAAMKMAEKAREHLVKKFKLSSEQISVFSVQKATWPDAGLGCPQEGMSYAQVETPGYMILLEAGGQTYNYHTDAAENVILCDAKAPGEIFLPP